MSPSNDCARVTSKPHLLRMMHNPLPRHPASPRGFAAVATRAWLRQLDRISYPSDNAVPIFDAVHLAPLEENLLDDASSNANLRFFVGYASWAPGQRERELAFGSWHIDVATEALVSADDPGGIWRTLLPPPMHRVSVDRAESSLRGAARRRNLAPASR